MGKHPYLSVVIPCYNEENNIRRNVLADVEKFLQKQSFTYEVVIVDDGSTDKSADLIKKFMYPKAHVTFIGNRHGGKAVAVTTGVLAARGDYILFTDFDQATPIDQFDKLAPYLGNFDVVIGSRSGQRIGAPLSRQLMAKGFILLRSLLLNMQGISDTQCGFKIFQRDVARQLFSKLQLYREKKHISGSSVTAGFDVELLFLAKKHGYRIAEAPVVWKYKETRRVSPIRDSLEGLLDLIRIRINNVRGVYGK